MKLTKKEAFRLHFQLWDWLYHNLSKEKWEWPEWKENGGTVFNKTFGTYCLLCGYTNNNCSICPLNCDYYNEWNFARSLKTRKKYAKLIRDAVL